MEKNGGVIAAGSGATGGIYSGEGSGGGDFSAADWKEKWVNANEDYEEDDDDIDVEEENSDSDIDYDSDSDYYTDSDYESDSDFEHDFEPSDSELDSQSDSDSDSDIENDANSDAERPLPETKQPPQPAKDVEENHEMTLEEEKEFANLAREFAKQLAAEEAQREEAEAKWKAGVGEKKKETGETESNEKQGDGGN